MGGPSPTDGVNGSAPHPDRQAPHLRLSNVSIFVRDLDKSLRFYLDQLGFSLAFDPHLKSGRRWALVSPPDGTAMLSVVQPKPDSAEYKLIGRPTHVIFLTEDVTAKFVEWRKRGVRFPRVPRLRRLQYEQQGLAKRLPDPPGPVGESKPVWGGIFTSFEDLDGNSFLLVSFDDVSREIEAQRRATTEKLESERRTAQELEIAKQVQGRLFPQSLPSLRTLDYAGICLPARAVGGDYYDFLRLGRDRLALVVGDISGKGIAAALLMASLQANLRSQGSIPLGRPQRVLRSVNQFFCENTPETAYATLFFAEYVDKLRLLRYVNCGHPSALLLRNNGTLERLESTCTVLGLFPDWDCAVEERRLSPGDTLALYTDGVTEARNTNDEEFGVERLIDALRRNRDLPSQAMLASIVDDVRKFSPHEQHDDITLIVAKCRRK